MDDKITTRPDPTATKDIYFLDDHQHLDVQLEQLLHVIAKKLPFVRIASREPMFELFTRAADLHWQYDRLVGEVETLYALINDVIDNGDGPLSFMEDTMTDINPRMPEQRAFTFSLSNCEYDVWFNEEQLQSFDDEDLDWYKKEMGLSRDSLFQIFAMAKEIVEQFKPNDEFLDLSYDVRGGWYITFKRTDTYGRWNVSVYRDEEHLGDDEAA
jgi:hypothetical protein